MAETETIPSDPGVLPTYRALQTLRFTVHEYLKGTGPNETVVVVRSEHSYLTEPAAQQVADAAVSARNTEWDGREGVLFLQTLIPSYAPNGDESRSGSSSTMESYGFTLSNYDQSEWDYSIDTLSRAWLPAADDGENGDPAHSKPSQEFITDGAESPPPTISLADLRTKIADMNATVTAGEGISGYVPCIRNKILYERSNRALGQWTPPQEEVMLSSGSTVGTEISRGTISASHREPEYHRFWVSGSDMALFRTEIDDDDSNANTGYDHTLVTERPLASGQYFVSYHIQRYEDIPCNFVPTDAYSEWTVTVTAPYGVLHEAFFDPVIIGTGVGADGSNGVLDPPGFTVDGTATTIRSLKWENSVVTMELSPAVSLTWHRIDFIALDGSTTLSLLLDDATVHSGTGTLTWDVTDQPWKDGDLLMLRIGESGARAARSKP